MSQGSRTFRKGELLAILGEIYRDKATGTLVLQKDQTNKFLYVQDGEYIFAASNAPEDKFTQILVSRGKLTAEQLAMATDKKDGRTIGRTLVEMGFLGSEDLLDSLVEQMRKIARSAVQWDEGLAVFKAGVLPPNIARLPLSTQRFIVDTALSIEDRGWAATTLGRMETPMIISPAERQAVGSLPPTPEEIRLLEQVDGKRNAREVCERAGVDPFYGARFFIGLSHLGLLHLRPLLSQSGAPKGSSEPLDLSFLDDLAPSPAPPSEWAPAAAQTPTPASLPPVTSAPGLPATAFTPVPAEPPSPPEAPPPGPRQSLPFETDMPVPPPVPAPAPAMAIPPPPPKRSPFRTPGAPDTVNSASEVLRYDENETGAPEDIGMHEPPRSRRLVVTLAAALAFVGVLAVAAWYFYLRPSDMIQLGPEQTAGKATKPGHKPPTPVPPSAATSNPEAAAGGLSPAPVPANPSPAPVQVTNPVENPAPPKHDGQAPPVATPAPKPPATSPAPDVPPPARPSSPAPAAGEGGQLLAAGKYPEAASAFLALWDKGSAGFTVSIEVACQPETVAKGYAAAAGSAQYAILPFDLKGRSCYLVVWGTYPDKASAEAALKALPVFFIQAAQPKVVSKAKILELSRGRR